MGLRGFVDAWGNPVKREGFTRPPLIEPKPALSNKSNTRSNTRSNSRSNKPAESNTPPPVVAPATQQPVVDAPAFDKATYQREYMRARRVKARESVVERSSGNVFADIGLPNAEAELAKAKDKA